MSGCAEVLVYRCQCAKVLIFSQRHNKTFSRKCATVQTVFLCTDTYSCTHVFMHTHTHKHAQAHAHTHHTRARMHTRTHAHTHNHIYRKKYGANSQLGLLSTTSTLGAIEVLRNGFYANLTPTHHIIPLITLDCAPSLR